jgi:hypothetical protein
MLMSYSFTYCPKAKQWDFYEMGVYSILFYFTHVVTIIIVANLVFWLKDIDGRFKDGDDSTFSDFPSLQRHRERLLKSGKVSVLSVRYTPPPCVLIENISRIPKLRSFIGFAVVICDRDRCRRLTVFRAR